MKSVAMALIAASVGIISMDAVAGHWQTASSVTVTVPVEAASNLKIAATPSSSSVSTKLIMGQHLVDVTVRNTGDGPIGKGLVSVGVDQAYIVGEGAMVMRNEKGDTINIQPFGDSAWHSTGMGGARREVFQGTLASGAVTSVLPYGASSPQNVPPGAYSLKLNASQMVE